MPDCEFCSAPHAKALYPGKQWVRVCSECEPDFLEVMKKEPEFSILKAADILDAFEYLDELRDSSRTNMNAACEYLEDEWAPDYLGDEPLKAKQSARILHFWKHSYTRRACAREAVD